MARLRGIRHVGVEREPSARGVGQGSAMEGVGQVGHGRQVTAAELRRLTMPTKQHTPVHFSTTHTFRKFLVALRKENTP